ncbi:MAG TPA: hypothetical protein VFU36_11835, partial [Jatrophihabitans sp.]|nr:hypothetical protein [Jatrophihabitans sp.]
GHWTADYVLMRAIGDPDVYLGTDLGVRRAVARLAAQDPAAAVVPAAASPDRATAALDPAAASPWRSYLTHHLWASAH